MYSGSGTILRYAVALATLKREPLSIVQIRKKRDKPGLRKQHLEAIRASCTLSGGTVEGAEVGATEILYRPGPMISGGNYHFDIGSAGSTTMAAFTLIPQLLFAEGPCTVKIIGGLFQDFAPSFFHMEQVLLPLLRRMGAHVELRMNRPGYVPQGQGELVLAVKPSRKPLLPLLLKNRGTIDTVRGIALASHLEEQMVAERMAQRTLENFQRSKIRAEIRKLHDNSAAQRGAGLVVWAETSTGAILGADRAGKQGRSSESIADFVTRSFLEDMKTGAATDRHLADQLILFAALAEGTSEYTIPSITDHVESNLWLVRLLLGVRTEQHGNLLRIHGIGFVR